MEKADGLNRFNGVDTRKYFLNWIYHCWYDSDENIYIFRTEMLAWLKIITGSKVSLGKNLGVV